MTDPAPRLSSLRFYPVKSCGGVEVERAAVDARGLRHDRRWMLVDPDGRFLSQRDHPRMCLVRPELGEEALRLEAPGMEPLRVDREARGEAVRVEVWSDRCRALDAGDEAAGWFGDFLGVSCRLVRQPEEAGRRVAARYAGSAETRLSFADGFPFLLTSEASLDELNRRLAEPLPMDRFRPNLVVAGAGPFAEDRWTRIRVGDIVFSVVKPCARCAVTTVDQRTAEQGREPLRTLADFRRGEEGVEFGQNLVHHDPGTLRRGRPVEVLAAG